MISGVANMPPINHDGESDLTGDVRPLKREGNREKALNKENVPKTANRASRSVATSRNHKKRRGNDVGFSDDTSLWNAKNGSEKETDLALERFIAVQELVSPSGLWRKHSSLAKLVVQCSQALPLSYNDNVLVEENCSELLNACRKCVKSASSIRDSSRTRCLRVAIHGLRAVCPIVEKGSNKWESALKILYHALLTSADISTSSKSKKDAQWESAVQCLAAYQAIGYMISGHRILGEKSDGQEHVVLELKRHQIPSTVAETFPIPKLKKTRSHDLKVSESVSQLFTILIRSTLAITSVFYRITTRKEDPSEEREAMNDFGGRLKKLMTDGLQENVLSFDTCLLLVRDVALPWLSIAGQLVGEGFSDEAVSNTKRAHRILWDAASHVEGELSKPDSDGASIHKQSLALRKSAILALLMYDEKLSSEQVNSILQNSNCFESACTYARKASAYFAQQPSTRTPSKTGDHLYYFHASVGSALDSWARRFGCQDSYFSFVEYCSYRTIHMGTRTAREQSSCCQGDCVIGQLKTSFVHRRCPTSFSRTQSESSDNAYSITYALLHLIQIAREDLLPLLNPDDYNDTGKVKVRNLRKVYGDILRYFRDAFFSPPKSLSHEVCIRCYRLLALHSLHRVAYKVLEATKRTPTNGNAKLPSTTIEAIEVMSRVLKDCIAPLVVKIATRGVGDAPGKITDSGIKIDLAADLYIRTISLLDRMHMLTKEPNHAEETGVETVQERTFSDLADGAMRSLYRLVLEKESGRRRDSCWQSIENAAKTLDSVGRRRYDRQEYLSCLRPQVYSTSLYCHLSRNQDVSSENASRLKLRLRFLHISSTFQKLGFDDQAFIALLSGVLHGVIERCLDANGDIPIRALETLAHYSNGLFAKYNHLKAFDSSSASLMSRFVSLYAMRLRNNTSEEGFRSDIDCDLSVSTLNEHLLRSVENLDQGTSCIDGIRLGVTFRKILLGEDIRDGFKVCFERGLGTETLHVLFESMVHLGAEIQRRKAATAQTNNNSDDPSSPPDVNETPDFHDYTSHDLIEDFEAILRVTLSAARSYHEVGKLPDIRMQEAMIYLLASSSLISSLVPHGLYRIATMRTKSHFDSGLLQRSYELALVAEENSGKCLSLENSAKHERLVHICAKTVISIYCSQLRRLVVAEGEAADVFEDVLSITSEGARLRSDIQDNATQDQRSMLDCATTSILCTLMRLAGIVLESGDNVHAAEAAMLSLQFSQGEEKHWNYTTAMTMLINGGFPGVAQTYLKSQNSHQDCSCRTSLVCSDRARESAAAMELIAVDTLLQLQSYPESSIAEKVERVKRYARDMLSREDDIDIMTLWVVSTCTEAVSYWSDNAGDIFESLHFLKECYKICQDGVVMQLSLSNDQSTWVQTMRSLLPLKFAHRQLLCLQRTAKLYARLGDHRSSLQYAFSALDQSQLKILIGGKGRVSFQDLVGAEVFNIKSVKQSRCYRLLLELKACASAPDTVRMLLTDGDQRLSLTLSSLDAPKGLEDKHKMHWRIDHIWNLLSLGDMIFEGSEQTKGGEYEKHYRRAQEQTEYLQSSPAIMHFPSLTELHRDSEFGSMFEPLLCHLKMREIRLIMSNICSENSRSKNYLRAADLCDEVLRTPFSPPSCRTWACYYLGLTHLVDARRSGYIQLLWQNHSAGGGHDVSCTDEERSEYYPEHTESIQLSRKYFKEVLKNTGPASQLLSRNAMRCLALVTGPKENGADVGMSAAVLIHSSIGSTPRQLVSRSLKDGRATRSDFDGMSVSEGFKEGSGIFEALDSDFDNISLRGKNIHNLLCEANELFPQNWRFVAAALCPTGELLLTAASVCREDHLPTPLDTVSACIFPDTPFQVHEEILQPLDDLILRSQDHLYGMDDEKVNEHYSNKSDKRRWWQERQNLDDELQSLLDRVGTNYFGSECVSRLFQGLNLSDQTSLGSSNSFDSDESSDLSCGNLASKFEQACSMEGGGGHSPVHNNITETNDRETLESMTVVQIKAKLDAHGLDKSQFKKMRKSELVDLLIAEEKNQIRRQSTGIGEIKDASFCVEEKGSASDDCLFLLLDENLHRFPFEGLDFLADKAVCRIPSIPFAMTTLLEAKASENRKRQKHDVVVEPAGASFVVDPEANLSKTKDRIVPVVEDLFTRHQWEWKGVVSTLPASTFVEASLKKENGLFLYCGHGGARSIFSRRQVESLIDGGSTGRDDRIKSGEQQKRQCRSTVILMGCSSGKLESVNRKDSESRENLPMFYEPEGIALSYLCAGAPCIVGNLWDVTDHDIDRYCLELLRQFLDSKDGGSLAQCVAKSRSACKMKYIVGCAPVCYGVPVHCLQKALSKFNNETCGARN